MTNEPALELDADPAVASDVPTKVTPARTFGLLSPCGWGNLGDAAIQAAMIHQIRQRFGDARIYAFTLNPEDTERRHAVVAYGLRGDSQERRSSATSVSAASADTGSSFRGRLRARFKAVLRAVPGLLAVLRAVRGATAWLFDDLRHSVRSYERLRGCDLLIVAGGGQLDDFFGGALGQPYALFKWALLARAVGADFIFLSVGTGVLRSPLSRFFTRRALAMASYRSYRDARTKGKLWQLGVRTDDPVVPDLAYSYPLQGVTRVRSARRPSVVGFSPIAYCHPRVWPLKDESRYGQYLSKLVALLKRLLEEGHPVVLFATDSPDYRVIRDLKTRLGAELWDGSPTVAEPRIVTVEDLFHQYGKVDLVVASRLHGLLLAHLAGRPALAISYDWKVDQLMEEMDQATYCLDIDRFTVDQAMDRFHAMEGEAERLERSLATVTEEYRARAENQYARVFADLETRRKRIPRG